MKTGLLIAVCMIIAAAKISIACIAPGNIEGVAFTNGESINFAAIEDIGAAGEAYIKDETDSTISYRYISHYSDKAMAYIGNVGMSYQKGVQLLCMGIILDPEEISESQYTAIGTEIFNFADAVTAELEWLGLNGIIDMSDAQIDEIHDSLSSADNGSMQYWTRQKDVLAYNTWYVYDTLQGVWGTSGVYVVEGVNSVRGCSVVAMAYELPPQQLGASAAKSARTARQGIGAESAWIAGRGKSSMLYFSSRLESDAAIAIYNAHGSRICLMHARAGADRIDIGNALWGMPRGQYIIECPAENQRAFLKLNMLD